MGEINQELEPVEPVFVNVTGTPMQAGVFVNDADTGLTPVMLNVFV